MKNKLKYIKSDENTKDLSTANLLNKNLKLQEEVEFKTAKEYPSNINTKESKKTRTVVHLLSGTTYSSNLNPDLNSEEFLWRKISTKNQIQIENTRSNKLEKYDVIKIGNIMLYISDILANPRKFNDTDFIIPKRKLNGTTENVHKLKLNYKILDNNFIENNSNYKVTCRVCYSLKSTNEDPLISLCNCTGSVRFIHFVCLQKWLKTSIEIKEGEKVITIKCKLYCELCKSTLPSKYHHINFSKVSSQ